jgi:hypothetical protein
MPKLSFINKCFLATSRKVITTLNEVVVTTVHYNSEHDGNGFENTSEGTWLNPSTCTLLFGDWSRPCHWIPGYKANGCGKLVRL